MKTSLLYGTIRYTPGASCIFPELRLSHASKQPQLLLLENSKKIKIWMIDVFITGPFQLTEQRNIYFIYLDALC